jgi:hypothetical protein
MLADELDYVVGVDTHRDRHTLATVAAPNGGVVAQRPVRTNARGYAEAVRSGEKHAPGVRLGGRRRRSLRRRPRSPPEQSRRDGRRPHTFRGASLDGCSLRA